MANQILYSDTFCSQFITELWKLGATCRSYGKAFENVKPHQEIIRILLNSASSLKTEHLRILEILQFLIQSYEGLERDDKNLEEDSEKLIKEGRETAKDYLESGSFIQEGRKNAKDYLEEEYEKPIQETDPLVTNASQPGDPLDEDKVLEKLTQALMQFQNKKQTFTRVIGYIFSFLYATFSALMNLAAFFTVASFSFIGTCFAGGAIFLSGFGINFLGSYRVIPEMFSKALTYIRKGCFWQSVFSYHDSTGKLVPLSPFKKGLLVAGFFASIGAAFGTSFLATSSLSSVLIALHIVSAVFPPALALVCLISFTFFMTPLLTYAFSSLIKQENLLGRTWQATKNFFQNIFGCTVARKPGETRTQVIFKGICTLVILGLSIWGLWATMNTFNVSMNTMLTGVFKVSESIANGVSTCIGIAMNFVAQIPFIIETVGRTIQSIVSWIFPSSAISEEKGQATQQDKTTGSQHTTGEKIKDFFSSVWVWFSKIGSAIGEALIAIDRKDALSIPAAAGQGISALASSNLDDDIEDQKTKVQWYLINKTEPSIRKEETRVNAPSINQPSHNSPNPGSGSGGVSTSPASHEAAGSPDTRADLIFASSGQSQENVIRERNVTKSTSQTNSVKSGNIPWNFYRNRKKMMSYTHLQYPLLQSHKRRDAIRPVAAPAA